MKRFYSVCSTQWINMTSGVAHFLSLFILLMTLLFRTRPKILSSDSRSEPYEMFQTCRCAPALQRGWEGVSGLSFGGCVGEAADRRSTDTHTPLESPERLRASAPSAAAHPSQRWHSTAAARNKTSTFMIFDYTCIWSRSSSERTLSTVAFLCGDGQHTNIVWSLTCLTFTITTCIYLWLIIWYLLM